MNKVRMTIREILRRWNRRTQTRRLPFSLILVLNLVSLSACKSEPQFPDPCWEGENILFATTASVCPCLGTLERLDNLVPQLENLLNEKMPDGEKIRFFWMPENMAGNPCPEEAVGCAAQRNENERYVFVKHLTAVAIHELTHAVLVRLLGGHDIFEEGIPTCFGNLHQYSSLTWEDSREDIESLFIPNFTSMEEYDRAGRFICYLLDQFGIDAVKTLYTQSEPNWDKDDFNAAFYSTIGVSFDTIIDEYTSGEVGCLSIPFACADADDVTTWDSAEQLTLAQSMQCEDSTTQGPFAKIDFSSKEDDEVSIGGTVYFNVAVSGYYRLCAPKDGDDTCKTADVLRTGLFTGTPEDPNEVMEYRLSRAECEEGQTCSLQPFELSLSRGLEKTLYMEPGRYQLEIRRHLAFGDLYQSDDKAEAELKFCRGDGLPVDNECEASKSVDCSDEECRVCISEMFADGGLTTVCAMCTCEPNTRD